MRPLSGVVAGKRGRLVVISCENGMEFTTERLPGLTYGTEVDVFMTLGSMEIQCVQPKQPNQDEIECVYSALEESVADHDMGDSDELELLDSESEFSEPDW